MCDQREGTGGAADHPRGQVKTPTLTPSLTPTIFEVKIKGLVDSMGRTARDRQRSLKAAPLVMREVQALQKLLGAVLGAYQ